MKRHTTRDGWWEFVPTLRNREEFKTGGALWGQVPFPNNVARGQLPREYWDASNEAVYVVYSYVTPIAWENADGSWTTPVVKYSVTTSRHQSKIFTAVDRIEAMRTGEA